MPSTQEENKMKEVKISASKPVAKDSIKSINMQAIKVKKKSYSRASSRNSERSVSSVSKEPSKDMLMSMFGANLKTKFVGSS